MKQIAYFGISAFCVIGQSPAIAQQNCESKIAIESLLLNWDIGQRKIDLSRLDEVLLKDARVIGIRPDATLDRSKQEFINEIKLSVEAEKQIKAYEHTSPKFVCNSQATEIVRRGCVVVDLERAVLEVAQTETITAKTVDGELRIAKVVTTMDAVRENGKELFRKKDFVGLKACKRAIRKLI